MTSQIEYGAERGPSLSGSDDTQSSGRELPHNISQLADAAAAFVSAEAATIAARDELIDKRRELLEELGGTELAVREADLGILDAKTDTICFMRDLFEKGSGVRFSDALALCYDVSRQRDGKAPLSSLELTGLSRTINWLQELVDSGEPFVFFRFDSMGFRGGEYGLLNAGMAATPSDSASAGKAKLTTHLADDGHPALYLERDPSLKHRVKGSRVNILPAIVNGHLVTSNLDQISGYADVLEKVLLDNNPADEEVSFTKDALKQFEDIVVVGDEALQTYYNRMLEILDKFGYSDDIEHEGVRDLAIGRIEQVLAFGVLQQRLRRKEGDESSPRQYIDEEDPTIQRVIERQRTALAKEYLELFSMKRAASPDHILNALIEWEDAGLKAPEPGRNNNDISRLMSIIGKEIMGNWVAEVFDVAAYDVIKYAYERQRSSAEKEVGIARPRLERAASAMLALEALEKPKNINTRIDNSFTPPFSGAKPN